MTKVGNKCPQCDKVELEEINKTPEDKKIELYSYDEFPFEKGSHYLQKEVRKKLGCGMVSGINYNSYGNFLVIFMNAHEHISQGINPYLDRYDQEANLYHYTGKGKTGDQTLTGANVRLANSTVDKTDIHFFRQHNVESKHEYMGLVKLEEINQNTQPDDSGNDRKVYEFLLKPI
jgi:hypothetical protein